MGGDEKLSDKITRLRAEIETLQTKLQKAKNDSNDTTLKEASAGVPKVDKNNTQAGRPKTRRSLKGHLAKIYAMHWAEDKVSLVSASQDGKLLVWDAMYVFLRFSFFFFSNSNFFFFLFFVFVFIWKKKILFPKFY